MFYEEDKPGKGPLFAVGVGATLLIHGGIVAMVLLGRAGDGKANTQPPLGQFVEVQAVRYGKPRDLSFLPHKEAPQVSKGPKAVKLTTNEHALPHLDDKKKPDQDDPLKNTHAEQFKNIQDDPPPAAQEEEGDPNGLRGGNNTVGKGPVYYQHLQAAVQNAWVVPTTINDDDLGKLKAMACMKIDAAGKIVEFHIEKTSHNDRFDATLLDALGSIKEFDPPTPDVKDVVTSDGVCMNFAKTR